MRAEVAMKVFMMWSGEASHRAAVIVKDLLEVVIQGAEIFISDDIEAGHLWRMAIAEQLQDTDFGVVFLTPENAKNHWIHFEAGAVARAVGKSNVCPLLLGLKPSDVEGPLADFQAAKCDKAGVERVVIALSKRVPGLKKAVVDSTFEWRWETAGPKLKELSVVAPAAETSSTAKEAARSEESKIDEVLLRLRRLEYPESMPYDDDGPWTMRLGVLASLSDIHALAGHRVDVPGCRRMGATVRRRRDADEGRARQGEPGDQQHGPTTPDSLRSPRRVRHHGGIPARAHRGVVHVPWVRGGRRRRAIHRARPCRVLRRPGRRHLAGHPGRGAGCARGGLPSARAVRDPLGALQRPSGSDEGGSEEPPVPRVQDRGVDGAERGGGLHRVTEVRGARHHHRSDLGGRRVNTHEGGGDGGEDSWPVWCGARQRRQGQHRAGVARGRGLHVHGPRASRHPISSSIRSPRLPPNSCPPVGRHDSPDNETVWRKRLAMPVLLQYYRFMSGTPPPVLQRIFGPDDWTAWLEAQTRALLGITAAEFESAADRGTLPDTGPVQDLRSILPMIRRIRRRSEKAGLVRA